MFLKSGVKTRSKSRRKTRTSVLYKTMENQCFGFYLGLVQSVNPGYVLALDLV